MDSQRSREIRRARTDVQSVGVDREPDHRQQRRVTQCDRSSGANTKDGRRLCAIDIVVTVENRDRERNVPAAQ